MSVDPYALESQVHTIIADLDRARANGTVYTYGNIQERLRNALHLAALSTQPATPDPSDCDHEFTDHCVFCGVDAHEWYNHYAGVKA